MTQERRLGPVRTTVLRHRLRSHPGTSHRLHQVPDPPGTPFCVPSPNPETDQRSSTEESHLRPHFSSPSVGVTRTHGTQRKEKNVYPTAPIWGPGPHWTSSVSGSLRTEHCECTGPREETRRHQRRCLRHRRDGCRKKGRRLERVRPGLAVALGRQRRAPPVEVRRPPRPAQGLATPRTRPRPTPDPSQATPTSAGRPVP